MAQSISLWGATYNNVPGIDLPKSPSGTARFTDTSVTTAVESDVASGKVFIKADGSQATGTNSGGGGGIGTLLATLSLGTISTSNTSATDTGKSIQVSDVDDYDLLIVETSVNTKTNGRHCATVGLIFLYNTSNIGTKSSAGIATAKLNMKISSNGTTSSRSGTTAYGIYPYSCSFSNGKATIPLYMRYNSTSTGTINGAYTTRVYGVKLYDLIGG